MKHPQRILVATDFSTHAIHAAQRAAQIAVAGETELDLLYVFNSPPLEYLLALVGSGGNDTEQQLLDDARQQLDSLAADLLARGVKARPHLRTGRPKSAILAELEETAADMLVLGAHGEHFVRDLILGSTAEKMVRLARVPVLMVRQSVTPTYRRVLVPVDFSALSRRTVEAALLLAPQATLYLLHVAELPFEQQMRLHGVEEMTIEFYQRLNHREAENNLHTLLEGIDRQRYALRPLIRTGYPPSVILECAQELDADLIVMGTQGKSEMAYLVLGSVSLHVLRESHCDVLAIKP